MLGSSLTTEVIYRKGFPVVQASGEVDLSTVSLLDDVLEGLSRDGRRSIILDLRRISYFDASGLNVLLRIRQGLSPEGGSLRLVSPARSVARILQLACTEALFPVFRSLDQALTEGAENTEPIIEPQAHQLEITIQAHPEMVGRVRKAFDRVARRDGLTRMEIEDIKLAVSEACTNAILHGSPLRDRNIVGIRYIRESDRVVIEIKDEGPGMTLESSEIIWPDELVEGKRGLYLIRTLMDDVAYAHGQEGGVLRMEKLCINKR